MSGFTRRGVMQYPVLRMFSPMSRFSANCCRPFSDSVKNPSFWERLRSACTTYPGVLPRGQRGRHDMHSPQYQMVSLRRSASMASSSCVCTVLTICLGS